MATRTKWTDFAKCFNWLPWVKSRQHIISSFEVNVSVQGGIAEVIADHFYNMLQESNAPNYLELRFRHQESNQLILVHVQKCEGKTPHELRLEAEKEVQRLTDEIARLKGANDDH